MTFTFTDENVNEIIESGKPVMIDFWATWCGPCVGMSPAVDTVAEEYEGRAVVGKYNIDEQTDLAMKYRIMSIPTILFFKDGKKTELRLVGAQSVETLRAKLDELLAL